jgi:catechol 2,3-dioxygenase-like lactoylglutathione lyase family enzyme
VRICFIGSIGVITRSRSEGQRFFRGALKLPLERGEGSDFLFSQKLEGSKYFGVWPLTEAARVCFGRNRWPAGHRVPQMFIEFEVSSPGSVSKAASELTSKGYILLHPPRTDPWGQRVVRLQTGDGLIIGISYVPWMHRRAKRRASRAPRLPR